MSAAIDIRARRRAACPRDAQAVVADIIDNVSALHATVAGWPMRHLRGELVADGEHHLDALHGLLAELRRHIPQDAGTTPPRAA